MKKFAMFFLLSLNLLLAQKFTISGIVTDTKGIGLTGVNIIFINTNYGTASDAYGQYIFSEIPAGMYELKVSAIGFRTFESGPIDINSHLTYNIVMEENSYQLGQVLISAGKHEQKIEDLPVSALIIGGEQIGKKNISKFDELLRYAPGVNLTLDQVSIRGSSGYSRGAGTRVLLGLDGIPLYSGDSGEIIWETIPVNDIARVEIVKGASSALYGSTAIGGVINVITKEISSQPVTYLKTGIGFYAMPKYDQWRWSNETRFFNNLSLNHSNGLGPFALSLGLSRNEDEGYRQGDWNKRYSLYSKFAYNIDKNNKLTAIFSGYMKNSGTFNYWKNLDNVLVPPDGDQQELKYSERMITGFVYSGVISKQLSLKITSSIYSNLWNDQSESANNSKSNVYRNEIQTVYKLTDGFTSVNGLELAYGKVKSNIFSDPNSLNYALYSSNDVTFPENFILSFGARFDNFKINNTRSFNSFSPKAGINYKLGNAGIIKASYGLGFRAPSLAETYTSTVTSGISVLPNPDLVPEKSRSFELSYMNSFSDEINAELSLFDNRYQDLIEPAILTNTDGSPYIQFDNLTKASIQGAEFIGNLFLDRIHSAFSLGYTYLWTRNIQSDTPLRYRPRHTINAGYSYEDNFISAGLDLRYWSKVEEYDRELIAYGLVADGDQIVEVFVVDLNLGFNLFTKGLPLKINTAVKNLFNYYYVEMIGNISPIRNISVNLEMFF